VAARKKPKPPKRLPVKDRFSSITSHAAAHAVKLSDFGPQWRHWTMIQGKLCAPDGRTFTPDDLMDVRQLRQELRACEREVATLQRELEEASRSRLEDQPLPKD
jgi:Phage protein